MQQYSIVTIDNAQVPSPLTYCESDWGMTPDEYSRFYNFVEHGYMFVVKTEATDHYWDIMCINSGRTFEAISEDLFELKTRPL